jgi:LmbE family N-acetylglucosaminyl deacetylase
MTTRRIILALSLGALALVGLPAGAQQRPLAGEGGAVGLGLVLRHLTNAGIFLEATAHPDDENSGLDAMLNRGLGIRTTLVTATRGAGGQNEIGPELGEALAVLRTEELAAVHRWDGTEQYFARAIDFGYSFSVEETFQKWGRQEILSDYVRLIRMIRPDVMIAMRPDGEGGGQHHQASARIASDAFAAAGDPSQFPEQLKQGLRAWQPKKFYFSAGFGRVVAPTGTRLVSVNSDVYDPLLGRTYAEIGSVARSNHKCQGMGQLLALPGPAIMQYRLSETTIPGEKEKAEASLFDGVDTSVAGLAQYVKGPAPEALKSGLARVARDGQAAQKAFETQAVAAALSPIVSGLGEVRSLLGSLGGMEFDESAKYEIGFRLRIKEKEFEQAAVVAQGLRLEALADDGVVVGGQPVKVTLLVANRGGAPVQVRRATLSGFDGEGACGSQPVDGGAVYRCESNVHIPVGAPLTGPYWRPLPDAERYRVDPDAPFGAPFSPTPFRAGFTLGIGGADVSVDLPVQHRYEGNIFSGEKRMELNVVPRFSVRMGADFAIIPLAAARTLKAGASAAAAGSAEGREVRVTVTNDTRGASAGQVSVEVPQGWRALPAAIPVEFAREDEAETVRFKVVPPPQVKPGEYRIRAMVRAGGTADQEGFQVIEYPHINRRHRVLAAETVVKVIDVKVAPNLRVGYIMGVGDQVPPSIEQIGVRLDMLGPDDLAWGDLKRYDAIVTGVRAYERRADLRASNHRLLDYVERGGTLIVQYNKFEFNEAQYGPYPAKVSSSRVTDENAPVQVLVPQDPAFTTPNRIGEAAWKGWVQERGLYFLGEKDPHYVDLVQMEDPSPHNKGMKRGALVECAYGKGRWVYVGLGLWRQLPAGTDGAFQLMANLISLGRSGPARLAAPRH